MTYESRKARIGSVRAKEMRWGFTRARVTENGVGASGKCSYGSVIVAGVLERDMLGWLFPLLKKPPCMVANYMNKKRMGIKIGRVGIMFCVPF
jgi:hypothetical protein